MALTLNKATEVKAAPAKAEHHEEEAVLADENRGTFSKNLQLVSFLYVGGTEKSDRITSKGDKIQITKPKVIVGARVRFLKPYDKVPYVKLDERSTRDVPFYVPQMPEIKFRSVAANQVIVLNIVELSVLLIDPVFNGEFYTEKTFKGYEKSTQPGQARDPNEKMVDMPAKVTGQYKRPKKGPKTDIKFTLVLSTSTPDSFWYRQVENCENVINPANDDVASPEFSGFAVLLPKRRRSVGAGAGHKGSTSIMSNPGAKAFLRAMRSA